VRIKTILSVLILFFICASENLCPAGIVLQISNYNRAVRFNDIKAVLIQKGDSSSYKDPGYNDQDWRLISIPSKWNEISFPGWNGICWYRLHINFPAELPQDTLGINLGQIPEKTM
jgi:hypothetical protein